MCFCRRESISALPEAEAYPEGAYPYNVGQAGEGVYPAPGSDVSTYDYGGNCFFAASSLASGIGVVKESLVPYGDSEGRRNSEGDWSLPEEQRYMQSFEYVVDEDNRQMDHLSLLDYDHMPAAIISSTLFEQPVYAANIFEVEEDSVLQYVSAMTGELDTAVTVSVYLMPEGAVQPTDGRLLESTTRRFDFAGYHRLELGEKLAFSAGSRIGVVVLERVPTADGLRYALTNTSSLGEKGPAVFNELHKDEGRTLKRYCKAVVNPGESLISFRHGSWIDWTNAIESFRNNGDCACMAYDNLPIKAYLYPLDEVMKLHHFENQSGETAICPECGYILRTVK